MFRGEQAKDAGEHLHSCLTTVRGFPWLYAYTADRSYLDNAVAACDRIYDTCTWTNGCVSEWTAPDAKHCFTNDEGCCTADEVMLNYQLADLTGEGRFFDHADDLYYNGLRFHQWFDGNFSGYDDPYVGMKGPHMWYCCTWWGSKALYETARHFYASSPTEVYVNGFMPSRAELPLKQGVVGIATEANIPASGDVRITVTPKGTGEFALNVRVPGWAVFRAVEVNGQTQEAKPSHGISFSAPRMAGGRSGRRAFRSAAARRSGQRPRTDSACRGQGQPRRRGAGLGPKHRHLPRARDPRPVPAAKRLRLDLGVHRRRSAPVRHSRFRPRRVHSGRQDISPHRHARDGQSRVARRQASASTGHGRPVPPAIGKSADLLSSSRACRWRPSMRRRS